MTKPILSCGLPTPGSPFPKWVVALLVPLASLASLPPVHAQGALDGRWDGAILVMGQQLTIGIDFTTTPSGLQANIDIPQQSAMGLPLSNVSYEVPNVHFELPAGPSLAVFDGVQRGDSITGEFTQAGVVGSFALVRASETTLAAADTLATAPPPYREEEITFANGDVSFAGTLTLPPGDGPHPAVVMISGSGPQNRDEELFGFKPFRIIADHLTRRGIAVLRYDDRGVGGSTGNVFQVTAADFADDVLAAVALLEARSDVAADRIGLVGHSEGGIVAPLAAIESADVAFLVLLAGTAVTGEEILLAQGELIARAGGASDEAVVRQAAFQRRSFEVVRSGTGWEALEADLREQANAAVDSMPAEQRDAIEDVDAFVAAQVNAGLQSLQTPWFRHFLDHDPVPALRRVRVPVLAVFGEFDLQVPPALNRQPMAAALDNAGVEYTIRVLPNANHLFLATETGSPSEYPTMEKVFVPEFLATIGDWIVERAKP